jgi:hypothetical protein
VFRSRVAYPGAEGWTPAKGRKRCAKNALVMIHDYKLLELSNMSMIGSERYAEAIEIAPGQQRFRGAFRKKPSME